MKYDKPRNPHGRPSSWRNGPTKNIRVPIALADTVLQIARDLDKKGMRVLEQNLECSKSTD